MTEQSIDELFDATLRGDPYDDNAWVAVGKLREIATREIFDRALAWAISEEPKKRQRSMDIISQFGVRIGYPRPYIDEAVDAALAVAESESDQFALAATIFALGHLGDARGLPLIIRHTYHTDCEVRYAVAFALGNFANDEQAIEHLMVLMADVDEDVRDWATFAVGTQSDVDTPEIRAALNERLNDPFWDAKLEGIMGLAKRRDMRALPHIIEALKNGQWVYGITESAYLMLGLDREPAEWKSGDDCLAALQKAYPSSSF